MSQQSCAWAMGLGGVTCAHAGGVRPHQRRQSAGNSCLVPCETAGLRQSRPDPRIGPRCHVDPTLYLTTQTKPKPPTLNPQKRACRARVAQAAQTILAAPWWPCLRFLRLRSYQETRGGLPHTTDARQLSGLLGCKTQNRLPRMNARRRRDLRELCCFRAVYTRVPYPRRP